MSILSDWTSSVASLVTSKSPMRSTSAMSQLSMRSFFTRGMLLSLRMALTCMGLITATLYPRAMR